MKTHLFKKLRTLVMAAMLVTQASDLLKAQCNANYTYTTGPNGTVAFQSTSTGTTANTKYSWSSSGSPLIFTGTTLSSITLTFTSNGFQFVCLQISDSVNTPFCYDSFCDTILVTNAITPTNSPCQANFIHTSGPNGSVSFTSTSTGVTPGTNYYWNFGSGSGNVIGSSTTCTYSTNGLKWVCLTITNTVGCNNTYCDSLFVTNASTVVPCNPSVVFGMFKDSTQALTWDAYAYYPSNVSGATWSWGDGSSTVGLYPSHTYSAAGLYSICVTVSVSCGTATAQYCYNASIFKSTQDNNIITVNVKAAKPTGISSVTKSAASVVIQPNPNDGHFTLSVTNDELQSQHVIVTDVMGAVKFEKTYSGDETKTLNLENLPQGSYFITVSSKAAVVHKRLMIEK